MNLTVKLYGTLPGRYPGYDAGRGLQVELDDGARLEDLFARLKLAESDGCFATVDGRVAKADELLTGGSCVCIFQRVFGG